jgi:hypothetical protein
MFSQLARLIGDSCAIACVNGTDVICRNAAIRRNEKFLAIEAIVLVGREPIGRLCLQAIRIGDLRDPASGVVHRIRLDRTTGIAEDAGL